MNAGTPRGNSFVRPDAKSLELIQSLQATPADQPISFTAFSLPRPSEILVAPGSPPLEMTTDGTGEAEGP